MGVMKRISTERQWNEALTGHRHNPELAAMYKLWQGCLARHAEMRLALPHRPLSGKSGTLGRSEGDGRN